MRKADLAIHAPQPMPPSRPLEVHRWSDYPELNNCLTDLVERIDALQPRQRKRTAEGVKRLRNAVRALVLDLYIAWQTDPDLLVGVDLSNGRYNRHSRYRALFLRYEGFRDAYEGLTALGYIEEMLKGFHDPRSGVGRTTRARATPALIQLLTERAELNEVKIGSRIGDHERECIILRGPKDKNGRKPTIEYDDTVETVSMRSDLRKINHLLERTWIDLYLTDQEQSELLERLCSKPREPNEPIAYLEKSRRQLVRIFNNSRWDHGGRFYGGWWQIIPREYRQHLTINGKPTVEVDYSGLHVALLYAEVGAELDGDAYDINNPRVPRDLIKTAFNKLLNATGRMSSDARLAHGRYGITWEKLIASIIERHAPIREHLRSGAGHRLQNIDAGIANQVLLRMQSMGYPCLPVHDSFIVYESLREELTDIMVEEFGRKTGATARTKEKLSFLSSYVPDAQTSSEHFSDLDEALGNVGPYASWYSRQLNWETRL